MKHDHSDRLPAKRAKRRVAKSDGIFLNESGNSQPIPQDTKDR